MSRWFAIALVTVCLSDVAPTHAEAVATFQGLGDLPGGLFNSRTLGISEDGSTVVGRSNSASGIEAFRWTSGTGMVGLGDLSGGVFVSMAYGVSADGSTVVGRATSSSGAEAFRWTNGTGIIGLGDLPGGGFESQAWGVSHDGTVVIGYGVSASGTEAFRWTSGTGMVGLGDLSGGAFQSFAYGVSADGSTVVGESQSGAGIEAFRWTSGGGIVGIGDLPGGSFESRALAISGDGSVVVGEGNLASGREAFRWTISTGMVGLGNLGGNYSRANGVSMDGSIVVGESNTPTGTEAFFWTPEAGMQNLNSLLASFSVIPTGFTSLNSATSVAVHENRTVIVGSSGSNLGTQAYLATFPIVSASLADEMLSLTPGLTSDILSLDVSSTKLLYGDISRYEFDFTTDGIYDLILDVGTPLFNLLWDPLSQSFVFSELEVRGYYPGINAGGFGTLTYTTTIRMTHENGSAINTSEANITVVPEVGSCLLGGVVLLGFVGAGLVRRWVI